MICEARALNVWLEMGHCGEFGMLVYRCITQPGLEIVGLPGNCISIQRLSDCSSGDSLCLVLYA